MVGRRLNKPGFAWVYCIAALLMLLAVPALHAQTSASISGTVTDSTKAAVAGANVAAVNEATNDKTATVTAKDGTYSFPVLQPGVYTISVEAAGFRTSAQHGITVFSGSRVSAPDTILSVGSVTETVNVQTADQILVTDNGSLGATLDAKDIEQLALESRNADELLKVLPGATLAPSTNNQAPGLGAMYVEPSSAVGGSISINGTATHGGVSDLLDGADINDPGCNCSTIAIVDPDMVQEVTVLSSSYGADVSHGPVIVNNISKSGSAKFHGSGFFYAKNDVLNAEDWQSKNNKLPRGTAHYYYPGFNIGGPVPFTHAKLLFWFGYEKFLQNTGNSTTLQSHIPSADMMKGNFTATAANSALCINTPISSTVKGTYCNDLTGTVLPDGSIIGVSPNRPAGMIPAQFLTSPAALDGLALASIWPAANNTNLTGANNYSNYIQVIPGVVDGYVYRARVDYNFSDRTKAYVSYQYGTDSSPASGGGAHIYWTPGNSIPFPGGGLTSVDKTYLYSGHFIHTFSSTLTNEALGTLEYAHNATVVPNVNALLRTTTNYVGGTIFNNGDPLVPSYGAPRDQTFPDHSQQDIFTAGAYNLKKPQPALADNLIKVWGSHTIKTGIFYESVSNNQGGFNTPNGSVGFDGGNTVNNNVLSGLPQGSPSNPLANLLLGNAVSYNENSANPNQDLAYKVFAFYIDDAWKASKRLNLEYGLRFDHFGRWYDRGNAGIPVFLPGRVASDFASGIINPGLQYHAINSAIPKSGVTSTTLLLSPRVGMSYDVFGTGNTIVRGGFGIYRFGDNWGDYTGGLGLAQGVQGFNLPNNSSVTLDQIGKAYTPPVSATPTAPGNGCVATQAVAATPTTPASPAKLCPVLISGNVQSAVDPNDHGNPTTYSYNFTISQRLPFNSLLEASYVGNQSTQILLGGGSGATLGSGTAITNINKEPLGVLFKADPKTGKIAPNPEDVTKNLDGTSTGIDPASYHPYGYAYASNGIYLLSHTGYSNYNSLQIAWVKRSSHLTFNVNYTHSKTLATDLNEDPFSLRGNYGVEASDRPNVFNTSFSYNDLKAYRGGNRLVGGAVNNWLISVITTYQGGGNLQAINGNPNPNFSYANTYTGALPAGVGAGISGATYFGTNAGVTIMPTLTCNPKSGLKTNQYVNGSCFAVPAVGTNGPRNYPYISGPAYFDSDMALAKTFHLSENHTVSFRASAFDWLNHPINAFTGQQLNLYFSTDYASKVSTVNTKQQVANFGTSTAKAGGDQRRLLELSVKYAF